MLKIDSPELTLHYYFSRNTREQRKAIKVETASHPPCYSVHFITDHLNAFGLGHARGMPSPKELLTGRGPSAGAGGLTQPNPILSLNDVGTGEECKYWERHFL